jgi:pentatricopeptide repeat protein
MPNRGLYPTDVTFNTLINACVLRTDYYQEAFNLLNQMQEVHGFEPDRITYNTLLLGCA